MRSGGSSELRNSAPRVRPQFCGACQIAAAGGGGGVVWCLCQSLGAMCCERLLSSNHGGLGCSLFVAGDAWTHGAFSGEVIMQLYSVAVFGAQYRLGIFCFLALQELIEEAPKRHTGNHGLLDQRGLLAWLQDQVLSTGKIFSGNAGGQTGWFSSMITNFLGVKRCSITYKETETGWTYTIP